VVPKGGVVAVKLLENDIANEMEHCATEEKARAAIKNDELERERRTVELDVKVQNFAKRNMALSLASRGRELCSACIQFHFQVPAL
jgi:hypothetical protein